MSTWRDQSVVVEGRKFTWGQVSGGKLYHGTPQDLEPGTVLEPGHGRNFRQSASDAVSLTSNAPRAAYWAKQGDTGEVHVYEVEPLEPLEGWRMGLAEQGQSFQAYEVRTSRARIVRRVS